MARVILNVIQIMLVAALLSACAREGEEASPSRAAIRWDMDTLDGWQDDSTADSPRSYRLEDGVLRMSTRPESSDRVKVATSDRFGQGDYTWRVYVPEMGRGDQTSIGAFLYKDDKREFDFEIGHGKASVRGELKAADNELVCYCTSQAQPYSSSQIPLARDRWHELRISLRKGKDGLKVTWSIDGAAVKELETSVETDTTFTIHCSLENLEFLGDHPPTRENHALFDWVEFRS